MTVALLIQAFLNKRGGAEKVAGKLANLLIKNGIECTIICGPKHSEIPSYEVSPDVEIIELSRKRDCEWFELRDKFDLLVGFAMSGLYAEIMNKAKVLNCPCVIQECSNPRRMISLMASNQQDGIATVREAFWLRQALLANANAIRFTSPDYEETVLSPTRDFSYSFYNSLGLPDIKLKPLLERPKKIIAVSALKDENKNGLAAARSFLKSGAAADGWTLNFYGHNIFQQALKDLQIEKDGDAIIDHGVSTDPNEMYADANMLLIPSFEEGLPNVVIEAFHYGMPAIGFADCPGTNHLIAHEERGYLVNDFSEDLMAQNIKSLCENPDSRRRMGEAAKEFADKNFDEKSFEENWLMLIGNAIEGKNKQNETTSPAINNWPDKTVQAALNQLTVLHQSIGNVQEAAET